MVDGFEKGDQQNMQFWLCTHVRDAALMSLWNWALDGYTHMYKELQRMKPWRFYTVLDVIGIRPSIGQQRQRWAKDTEGTFLGSLCFVLRRIYPIIMMLDVCGITGAMHCLAPVSVGFLHTFSSGRYEHGARGEPTYSLEVMRYMRYITCCTDHGSFFLVDSAFMRVDERTMPLG